MPQSGTPGRTTAAKDSPTAHILQDENSDCWWGVSPQGTGEGGLLVRHHRFREPVLHQVRFCMGRRQPAKQRGLL